MKLVTVPFLFAKILGITAFNTHINLHTRQRLSTALNYQTPTSDEKSCPFTSTLTQLKGQNEDQNLVSTQAISPSGPSFLEALFGIGLAGSPWEYMLQMTKNDKYTGIVPVNLSFLGVYNFLLTPEAVRAATVEEANILPRRFSVSLFEQLELDRGIVYEQGERHKRNKRLCIPSFEQGKSMESFVQATKVELDELSESLKKKDKIDLYAEMRRSALNVVLDVSFGLGSERQDEEAGITTFEKADELSATIAEYLERIVALANEIPPLWQIAPRLSGNYVRVTDVLLPNLRSLVAEVISKRRIDTLNQDDGRNKADLLGVLVEQGLDDFDIRSILFDVVIAGSDTTASTTTASVYILHLPENKEWLDKARKEAEETNCGRDIPLDQLRSAMPVCVGIAREVLRLYPPVPFVGRTATERGSLLDGQYPVEVGDTFCFSPWFLGRNQKEWGPDADKFNPQRWIDDSVNGCAPNSFSWLPFGAGARGCLGTRLGLTEVVLGISRLVRDFEFDFETKGNLPVKYDLTLNLDDVMRCNIRKR